jgi:hypothetical protein
VNTVFRGKRDRRPVRVSGKLNCYGYIRNIRRFDLRVEAHKPVAVQSLPNRLQQGSVGQPGNGSKSALRIYFWSFAGGKTPCFGYKPWNPAWSFALRAKLHKQTAQRFETPAWTAIVSQVDSDRFLPGQRSSPR